MIKPTIPAKNPLRTYELYHTDEVKTVVAAHTDLNASRTFLKRQTGEQLEVGSMARPVRLKWDDPIWSELSRSPEGASPNEERTNRSTRKEKLASVGAA